MQLLHLVHGEIQMRLGTVGRRSVHDCEAARGRTTQAELGSKAPQRANYAALPIV